MRSFTLFEGLLKSGQGYVTVLRFFKGKKPYRVIEFWDAEFYGKGRYYLPEEEKLIGVMEEKLVFFKPTEDGVKLIIRKVAASDENDRELS